MRNNCFVAKARFAPVLSRITNVNSPEFFKHFRNDQESVDRLVTMKKQKLLDCIPYLLYKNIQLYYILKDLVTLHSLPPGAQLRKGVA